MDRLSPVKHKHLSALALCVVALGCGDDSGKSAAPSVGSRVVAVAAKDQASTSELCDVLKPAESAPTFAYPPLDSAAPTSSGAWRWLNVWASWCAPCVEELPLMTKLHKDLDAAGARIDVELLSVDAERSAMETFQSAHPEAKGSLHLSDMTQLQTWLTSVGLDAGATLPVHLFIDPQGKVRCARTGAIKETDLPAIKKLISG